MITPEQLAKSNTEHGHQCALFCWCAQNFNEYPQLRFMFAIPNGGQRNVATAARLKAEGVKAGVPDIFLAVPAKDWHGMFIELKVGRNKQTEEQRQWSSSLQKFGYYFQLCYSWIEARNKILEYLGFYS